MNTYYTSMRHAVRALDRLAQSHNIEAYQDLDIRYIPGTGIRIANHTSYIIFDMEQHTKKEMRSKLINFMGEKSPEVVKKTAEEIRAQIKKTTAPRSGDLNPPNYANATNAVKSLNTIAIQHDPDLYKKIDIQYFPKIGIRIATSKSVLTFNVDEYTKYQLRSIIVRYMEELRDMDEYYKSVNGAIHSLELIATNYNKELFPKLDILYESRFEIKLSNGKSTSTLHIRRHTKLEMKERLIRYMEAIQ